MTYDSFIFTSYEFDVQTKTLTLTYGYDDQLTFHETYRFDFPFVTYSQAQLDRAFQQLFYMAGVSYYKAYLAPSLVIRHGSLTTEDAAFFARTYQRGLGEFYYINKLDLRSVVPFVTTETSPQIPQLGAITDGLLIGLGGGKDSLVSVELLRDQPRVATWSLDHHEQLAPLVNRVGLPHFSVSRTWDRQLLNLNETGAYNGHVPISAIFACVGSIVGILSGYNQLVVSNENSANEPTLVYDGVAINHQYSKSLAFEQEYQALLGRNFGNSLQYFSFARPLSELRIAELFARVGFAKYQDVFSSCNRAFVHTSHELFWCGECPKCAFVFLALTPFVEQTALTALWHGKNLLLDPLLVPTYKQLLGIAGDKPLECVGEIKESRAAMRLAQAIYPEALAQYEFEIPEDYDYKQLAGHAMPSALYDILRKKLTTVLG